MRRILPLYLLALTVSLWGQRGGRQSATTLPPGPDMTHAPEIGAVQPYLPPSSQVDQIPNGVKIIAIEDHRFPLVSVMMAIRAGTSRLTPDEAGLADAEADLLTAGTPTRNALQIAQAADTYGGGIDAEVGPDYFTVSASALNTHVQGMIQLLADVVLHPTFPQSEVDLRKNNMLQELEADRADPEFLATVQFDKLLFGPHPYAIAAPNEATIARISRETLQAFHDKYFLPNNQSVVVVAGDVSSARAHNLVYQYFGDWKFGNPTPPPSPEIPPRAARSIVLVDRPDSAQSQILLGNLSVNRQSPDYFPFIVANEVLGGSFNSRLVSDIRERQGLAYDIGSLNHPYLDTGAWSVVTQVRTAATADAVQAILDQVQRMRAAPVSADELTQAKNYLSGNFVLSLETQSSVAAQFLGQAINNVPPDYLATWVSKVQGVTVGEVQAAAQKYMQPDKELIVIVGDVKAIEQPLTKTTGGAAMTIFDVKGNTVGSYPPEGTKPGGGHAY